MKNKYDLEFCFKGSRDYVHGTDIFNKLTNLFQDNVKESKIDLSFHGIAQTNIDLVTKKPDDEKLIKFVFKSRNDLQSFVYYGIENHSKINCRYEYPEEEICKASNINVNTKRISLKQDTGFSFIENIVALNKYLLETLFQEINGKWYFTRLQLDEVVDVSYPIELELKANFNFKLTKSAVFVDNKLLGYLYFSLV